jgi:hypothetical protein
MAHRIPARLTTGELRRFGLTVGGAFGALTVLLWWRGGFMGPRVMGVIAVLLVAGGILAPSALGPVNQAWMRLATVLSRFTTPIVMGVLFYLIITPVGLLMRLFKHNPLVRRSTGDTFWIDRAPGARQSTLDRPY